MRAGRDDPAEIKYIKGREEDEFEEKTQKILHIEAPCR